MKQILYILLLFTFSLNAQQPAFPTAYGGGAYATGGRGGNVYHVTNLLDDGSVGSLRWAIAQPRPATVVFDVSGTIEMTDNFLINGENLTIAGQTAPQGGITLTFPPNNWEMRLRGCNNVIVRYIRVRYQFYGASAVNFDDGYAITDFNTNIIFDHVSINWAGFQTINIKGENTDNITMQNSMLAESSRGALFGDSDAPISNNLTFARNVFYQVDHRVPNITAENAEVYNNVIYDWTNRLTLCKDGTTLNNINNYYYKGNRTFIIDGFGTRYVNGITIANGFANPQVYSDGNRIQDFYDGTGSERENIWMHHAGTLFDGTPIDVADQQKFIPDASLFLSVQPSFIGVAPTLLTAIETSTQVPEDAGANKYLNADGTFGTFRDEPDQRYRDAIINDIPTAWDGTGGTGGRHSAIDGTSYSNFLASVNSTPINTRPVGYDTDSDGMADVWEVATFGDLTKDGTVDTDLNGYTDLEEFLNQVDGITPEVPDKGDTSRILKILISN